MKGMELEANDGRRVITVDEIRDVVKANIEHIRLEDIFPPEALKAFADKARSEGYSEGYVAAGMRRSPILGDEKKADEGVNEDDQDDGDKYVDPAKNPFIKTE